MTTNLPHGARYIRAIEVVRNSKISLTKPQIEQAARICPFSSDRWWTFQTMYQDEIVVHPITKKIVKIERK